MLNKKIIAAAVAAVCSTSALADIDLDSNQSQLVTYAAESFTAAQLAAGTSVVTDAAGGDSVLPITTELGFSIGSGTSRFVRFDLANGSFNAPVTAAMLDVPAGAGPAVGRTVTVSNGGTVGSTAVVFEIAAGDEDLLQDATITLDTGAFRVATTGAAANVRYRLFETGTAAANPSAPSSIPLKDLDRDFARVQAVSTTEYAVANNATATFDSGFTRFDDGGVVAQLGLITPSSLISIASARKAADSELFTAEDVLGSTTEYQLRIDGDVSFGTAYLVTGVGGATPVCGADATAGVAFTEAVVNSGIFRIAGLTGAVIAENQHAVCIEAQDNDVINRGDYALGLIAPNNSFLPEEIGSIFYNTVTVDVPYVSTFADYNQRIYIVNNGSTDAGYSTTFTAEDGVTVAPGTAATGTVPANSMVTILARDLVTLDGRTRTSAVIDVDARESDISVSTQTINTETGGTDTVVLNGNSITSAVQN